MAFRVAHAGVFSLASAQLPFFAIDPGGAPDLRSHLEHWAVCRCSGRSRSLRRSRRRSWPRCVLLSRLAALRSLAVPIATRRPTRLRESCVAGSLGRVVALRSVAIPIATC